MRWWFWVVVFLCFPVWVISSSATTLPKYFRRPPSTADHSKFEVLNKDFRSPEEVTKACLSCHNKAGDQFKKTLHYTWTWKAKDGRLLGKAYVINNF